MPSYTVKKVICPCCNQDRFTSQFLPMASICRHCSDELTPSQAFNRGREFEAKEQRYRAQTRAGRKEVRVEKKRAAQDAAGGKRCGSCYARKPATSEFFGACAPRGDGLQPYCLDCTRMRAALMRRPGGLSLWRDVRASLRMRNEPAAPAADALAAGTQQPLTAPGRIPG